MADEPTSVKPEDQAQNETPAEETVPEEPVTGEEEIVQPAAEDAKAKKPSKKKKPVKEVSPSHIKLREAPPEAKWYVVHTYSGHENKVSATLKQRVETMKLEDKIFDIIVPTRNIVTVRHGKKEEQKEKIFPGYILVRMMLDDSSWLAVRTTQGVTAFVGVGNKPTPISNAEVSEIVKYMEMEAPKYKTTFSVGEAVKIVDGPFADFLGTVDSIDEEKGKVKVLVSIFGRETPVELDFLQVSKL
jgi:transcription termination/antitermination protein NusG